MGIWLILRDWIPINQDLLGKLLMTHREGRNIYLIAEQGEYFDFGSGKNYKTRPDCELILDAPDGIALLWKQ